MLRSKKMNLELFLPLFLFIIHPSFATASYTPVDNYLIACGSSKNITDHLGRTFLPDSHHFSMRFDSKNSVAVSSSSRTLLSPIYQSARTFTTSASYKFHINQKGWHFVRLHFHPLSHWLASVSSLTVAAENYVLLHNHNFSFHTSNGSSYLSKEYAIHVNTNTFTLTFVPSRKYSVVFVNAIEVVSIPNEVFSFNSLSFPSNNIVALETMYRLDMGGSSSSVTSQNDALFRIWEVDDKYLQDNLFAVNLSANPLPLKSSVNDVVLSSEVAPEQVYATAKALKNVSHLSKLTWVFPVDPNFTYLLRMHFCDIISRSRNKLIFNVYINSDVVKKNLNLSALTYDVGVPFFIDFVANSSRGSDKLSISIEPSDLEVSKNAIINGLEVMKMSSVVRSSDGLSSVDDTLQKSPLKIPKVAMFSVGASFLLAFTLIGAFLYYCHFMKSGNWNRTCQNNHRPRKFTFQQIQEATNNFEEQHLIGVGGFGKVFMGKLENGTKVAIKRAKPQSNQGMAEFQNEIDLLSKLRHHHLVSLIGYCHEDMKMVLVYEYMANGSLSSHLYGPDVVVPVSWKQRLEICIGAARGLHFLHTGNSQSIIHRDVKSSNILLDENFVAKVSDFGISRIGPSRDKSHVSTVVKGSFGYIDPEYFKTQRLSEKSDVYSFGVVLLEVICGRPALNRALPTQEKNLANWALICHENNGELLEEIIDPTLMGKAKVETVKKVWEVARMCLKEHRINRPTMEYVTCSLEEALRLELRNSD